MNIPTPNFTQIPNVVFDYWIPKLKPAAGIVLMILCRKIFGWHKTSDRISKNQLCESTGLSKNTVQVAIDELEANGLILKFQSTTEYGCQPNTYSLNVQKPLDDIYSDKDQILDGGRSNSDLGVGQILTGGVGQILTPQKKDSTKERLTKEIKQIHAPPKGDAIPSSSSSADYSKAPKKPYKSVQLNEHQGFHPQVHEFKQTFNQPLIGISDEHHTELMNKYGLENTRKFYAYLAEWKLSKAQVAPKSVTSHSDYYRIKKWVIKEVLENPSAMPGTYKRSGKLAIEADKTAMSKLQETGTSYVSAEDFARQLLEDSERKKQIIKDKERAK